jgi:hypothetical protein
LDLDLANFYGIRLIEELNHAHTHGVNDYAEDSTAFPAFSTMSHMSSFIPATPRRQE